MVRKRKNSTLVTTSVFEWTTIPKRDTNYLRLDTENISCVSNQRAITTPHAHCFPNPVSFRTFTFHFGLPKLHLIYSNKIRFRVAVCSEIDHRWHRNVVRTKLKVAHEAQLSDSLMFLPQFDVFWDLLQYRPVLTWEIFVLYDKKA